MDHNPRDALVVRVETRVQLVFFLIVAQRISQDIRQVIPGEGSSDPAVWLFTHPGPCLVGKDKPINIEYRIESTYMKVFDCFLDSSELWRRSVSTRGEVYKTSPKAASTPFLIDFGWS